MTFDHVVPRSQGGRTTWDNIVTACAPCNLQEGRAHAASGPGMLLMARPVPAGRRCSSCRPTGGRFPPHHLHESWLDYLYWDIELEP
jgi:hypothetical protein